jgi:hypothetical protein
VWRNVLLACASFTMVTPTTHFRMNKHAPVLQGIFHSCIGTMAMLFTSVINLVWKLQDIANN